MVKRSWRVTFPKELPHRPDRVHWAALQRQKKDWAQQLLLQANSARVPQAVKGERRSVQMLLHSPGRRRHDKDNLNAHMKVPLDALVNAGLLYDDNDAHVAFVAASEYAPTTGTVIVLTYDA